jgi:hypothetical protein
MFPPFQRWEWDFLIAGKLKMNLTPNEISAIESKSNFNHKIDANEN